MRERGSFQDKTWHLDMLSLFDASDPNQVTTLSKPSYLKQTPLLLANGVFHLFVGAVMT